MLSGRRAAFDPLMGAFAKVAAALRLRPSHVTWASLIVTAAGAAMLYKGLFIPGAWVLAFGVTLDAVDGTLARATGQVSLRGGYLDSLLDRFADFFVLLGLLAYYDTTWYWIVGTVALFGAVTTSFAKARVFQDRHPDARVWRRDILERSDRFLLLLPAIFAQGILDKQGKDVEVVFWVLVVFAALAMFTVIQRMRTAWKVLEEPGR